MNVFVVAIMVALVLGLIAALFAGVAALPVGLLIVSVAVGVLVWRRTRVGPPSTGA